MCPAPLCHNPVFSVPCMSSICVSFVICELFPIVIRVSTFFIIILCSTCSVFLLDFPLSHPLCLFLSYGYVSFVLCLFIYFMFCVYLVHSCLFSIAFAPCQCLPSRIFHYLFLHNVLHLWSIVCPPSHVHIHPHFLVFLVRSLHYFMYHCVAFPSLLTFLMFLL